MRFIHIADVHLGASPEAGRAYSGNRGREIWDTFQQVLEVCECEKTDVLLIAGDLFHRQPLLRELKEVDYMFSKLTHTSVVLIAGNHDYIKENSYYGSFVWSENVYPIFSECIDCIEIEALELAVYGCSYHQKEVKKERLQQDIQLVGQKYHILLGHGGDATHMPFEINQMKQLQYDYIALGHIHKPQIMIEDKMAYAGALEPSDIADYGCHGYILGEIKLANRNETRIKFVEFASREYKEIKIDVHTEMTHYRLKDEIREEQEKYGVRHMYHVELQGVRTPEVLFDLEDLFAMGNIVAIEDYTILDYDLQKLEKKNRENLLGAYIRSFGEVEEGSIEYMALYEGVRAIEETKKG
ncbi:MAG: DNA repair exonuclease [Eubacteriales bacterium]